MIDDKSYAVSAKSNNETGYTETFCYRCDIKPTGLDTIDFVVAGIEVKQKPKEEEEETEEASGANITSSSWVPPKLKINGSFLRGQS